LEAIQCARSIEGGRASNKLLTGGLKKKGERRKRRQRNRLYVKGGKEREKSFASAPAETQEKRDRWKVGKGIESDNWSDTFGILAGFPGKQ